MPAELIRLDEQLLKIKIVYEDALLNDKPISELKRLNNQIREIENLIVAGKDFMQVGK